MTDVMASLRTRFLDRCAGDLARIDRLLEHAGPGSKELQGLVHSLAGAAGTFGFPAISVAAGECDDAYAEGRAPGRAAVERLTAAMREALITRTG